MTYYTYYSTDYLAHHGIKGQKWGVRRFQNPDGTLTEAGKARYGDSLSGSKNPSNKGFVRRALTGDHPILGTKRIADKLEGITQKQIEKRKAVGKDTKELEKYYETQKKQNIDRDKYLAKTSTGKLLAQNFLMGGVGSHFYRNARARNESRASAFIESLAGTYLSPAIAVGIDQYKKEKHYNQ